MRLTGDEYVAANALTGFLLAEDYSIERFDEIAHVIIAGWRMPVEIERSTWNRIVLGKFEQCIHARFSPSARQTAERIPSMRPYRQRRRRGA